MEALFMDDLLLQDETTEELEDEDIDLSDRNKITFLGKDSDIDGLHRQDEKGRLLIQPDYQRKYVWDTTKASKLIESILINIPIPIVYLAATRDGKINVIDGQQRLTSIFSFIEGKFPDGRAFKLSGLQVKTELKGKTFKDLDEEDQNKIFDYSISLDPAPDSSLLHGGGRRKNHVCQDGQRRHAEYAHLAGKRQQYHHQDPLCGNCNGDRRI